MGLISTNHSKKLRKLLKKQCLIIFWRCFKNEVKIFFKFLTYLARLCTTNIYSCYLASNILLFKFSSCVYHMHTEVLWFYLGFKRVMFRYCRDIFYCPEVTRKEKVKKSGRKKNCHPYLEESQRIFELYNCKKNLRHRVSSHCFHVLVFFISVLSYRTSFVCNRYDCYWYRININKFIRITIRIHIKANDRDVDDDVVHRIQRERWASSLSAFKTTKDNKTCHVEFNLDLVAIIVMIII